MANTVSDLCKTIKTSEDIFVSAHSPAPLGIGKTTAYGACALTFGINSACETVEPDFFAHSVTGAYLSAASTQHKLHCAVQRLSTSSFFATRVVVVSQQPLGEKQRLVLQMIVSFHRQEQRSLVTFSSTPTPTFTSPEHSWTLEERNSHLKQQVNLPKDAIIQFDALFALIRRYFEWRQVPDSVSTETLNGVWQPPRLSQEFLSIQDRTSQDWLKPKDTPRGYIENLASLAFIADGFNAFTPVVHGGYGLHDFEQCSNLDFALRIFSNKLDLQHWHFRELKTAAGGEGRTFNETKIWDLSGKLVASMTQQALLRPAKPRLYTKPLADSPQREKPMTSGHSRL